MEIIVLLLLGLLVIGAFFYFQSTMKRSQSDQSTQLLMNQLNAISQRMDERLRETSNVNERTQRSIGERLDNAAKFMTQLTGKLSQLEEANKRIFDIGKDLSGLQQILQAPKLRGNLGELFLGDLLTQIFPKENFTLQYRFKTGATVDAVIHLRENMMVPVDAKFPLENFKRVVESEGEEAIQKARKTFVSDVRKHIDDIASKYILTDEGTFDFALMYVPAENVYYEIIVKDQEDKSISQYALSKRVIPVSPNSFYIYLQALIMGLKGLQIERSAKDILVTLGRLQSDFGKFSEDFELVGTHLGRAQSSYHNSEKRLGRLKEKLDSVDTPTTEQIPAA